MSIEYCVDIKVIQESWLIEFTLPNGDEPRTFRVDQDYKVTPMTPSAVEWIENTLNMEMLTGSIKYTMERNLSCFYIIL
tara:strand:+ start:270 stop:506 length:237 start_codon:yes stop_codon:yes gene_type:complete